MRMTSNELKNMILSSGYTKNELLELVNNIFPDSVDGGNACRFCSSPVRKTFYQNEGLYLLKCSACPSRFIEFTLKIKAKKQKEKSYYDDIVKDHGLFLRGVREGDIDDYIQFLVGRLPTIELRAKDFTLVSIPFFKLNEELIHFKNSRMELSKLLTLIQEVEDEERNFNTQFTGRSVCNISRDENYRYSSYKQIIYEDDKAFEDEDFEGLLNIFKNDSELNPTDDDLAFSSIENKIEKINDAWEVLSHENQEILRASIIKNVKESGRDSFYFALRACLITNESTNIKYEIPATEILQSNILNKVKEILDLISES